MAYVYKKFNHRKSQLMNYFMLFNLINYLLIAVSHYKEMNYLNIIFAICLCGFGQYATGYKILGLFAHPGLSHFNFFKPILRGLADAGHEVTVISHFPEKNPPKNYKDLPLDNFSSLVASVDLEVGFFLFINFKLKKILSYMYLYI